MNRGQNMNDKSKAKPTEEEVQAWLEGVHFSSCCSDLLPSDKSQKSKAPIKKEKSK
jgi:hypothetical protein